MAKFIAIDKAEEDFFNIRCDGGCKCYPDGCDSCLIYEGAEFFINYETEDVQPVIHGEWQHWVGWCDSGYKCSVCNFSPKADISDGGFNYCPNCGAKMGR